MYFVWVNVINWVKIACHAFAFKTSFNPFTDGLLSCHFSKEEGEEGVTPPPLAMLLHIRHILTLLWNCYRAVSFLMRRGRLIPPLPSIRSQSVTNQLMFVLKISWIHLSFSYILKQKILFHLNFFNYKSFEKRK